MRLTNCREKRAVNGDVRLSWTPKSRHVSTAFGKRWEFDSSQQKARSYPRFTGKIRTGGPLRIVAWSIWSGRERSSHNHSPQVPQTRLAFFLLTVENSHFGYSSEIPLTDHWSHHDSSFRWMKSLIVLTQSTKKVYFQRIVPAFKGTISKVGMWVICRSERQPIISAQQCY